MPEGVGDGVVISTTIDFIGASSSADDVITAEAQDAVVVVGAFQNIVADGADDFVQHTPASRCMTCFLNPAVVAIGVSHADHTACQGISHCRSITAFPAPADHGAIQGISGKRVLRGGDVDHTAGFELCF